MSTQSVNATILPATNRVLYPVHSGFRGWEILTHSFQPGTLLKVVAVAVISGLIGFLLGAYWERSRSAKTLKSSEGITASPVVEPPKREIQQNHTRKDSEGGGNLVAAPSNAIASGNALPIAASAPSDFKVDWSKLPNGISKIGIEKMMDAIRKLAQPGSREVTIPYSPTVLDFLKNYLDCQYPYDNLLIKAQIITKYKVEGRVLLVTLSEEFFKTLPSS